MTRNTVFEISRYLSITLLFALSGCEKSNDGPPYSPEDALKTFQLPEGFRMELVASEPLITDPVEIAFDAAGLLYVAEMEDYPAHASPGGRIMLLEDKDHNGHFETGHVFADSLPYVNGVMPWRKGVLVTSAPDILYLEDTNGDRRADIRRVVLTGFAFTNPQLRMSSLRYGLDNKIYGAYSRAAGMRGYPEFTNHGSPLRFPDDPEKDSADIYPGTDFRFDPGQFKAEPAGGMSQFGLAFDDAGNRFTVWNNIHLRHVVIDGRYRDRNPDYSIPSDMASVSDHGDAATVYSKTKGRLDLHESEIGHFTSACGVSVYTGDLFGEDYHYAAFVCEPVSNLVHVDLLTPRGATFSGKRQRDTIEFLTSTDSWFRPVNATVGPDGALYVVDFYRKLVEHPAWIARADDKGMYTHAGMLQESDFLEGNDRGRIYRVVPETFYFADSQKIDLANADMETLAGFLDTPSLWWRSTAQRLLVERQDIAAPTALKKMWTTSLSPEGKIHVLWTLEGLHHLENNLVITALADQSPVVRRQAVILAERRTSDPEIVRKLSAMAGEPDEAVLFQVALTFGNLPPALSFAPLRKIALERIADPWFQTAALLAEGQDPIAWFNAVVKYEVPPQNVQHKRDFLRKISSVAGARQKSREISQLLSGIADENTTDLQVSSLIGLREGLAQGTLLQLSGAAQTDLLTLIASPSREVQQAALKVGEKIELQRTRALAEALSNSLKIVLDKSVSSAARLHAIGVMGLDRGKLRAPIFDSLLTPGQAAEIQRAAANVLISRPDTTAMRLLLKRWEGFSPEVREVVESGFANSASRLSFFLKAMEKGDLSPAWLSRSMRSRLVGHSDKKIREQSEKFFGDLPADKREDVVTKYYPATTLQGDPAKGKTIFKNVCSACHLLEGVGRHLGPDLLSVSNQTRINLLAMILDPNNNISPGYDGYFVETTGGETLAGILAQETSEAVVLRTADGQEHRIARDRIKAMRPMTSSLMPDGLEAGLGVEEVADLIEYLKKP